MTTSSTDRRRRSLRKLIPCFVCLLIGTMHIRAGVILDAPNARVTDSGLGRFGSAAKPNLAARGHEVFATWLDDRANDQNSVLFARSSDRGLTWSTNIQVSTLPYDDWCENPQITVQPDGTLWIVWYLFYTANSEIANDLRIARSTNNGASWDQFTLKDGVGHEDLWKTRIASDAQNVYVAFHDYKSTAVDEGYDLMLFTIQTATLSLREVRVNDVPRSGRITDGLLDDGPRFDLAMRSTALGQLLCVAWEDSRNGSAIYCACSTNQGATFGPSSAVSEANAVNPQLALSPDGTLFATYALESDADNNVQLRSSTSRGGSWTPTRTATQIDLGRGRGWDLAVDNTGQVVLAWIEDFFGESNLNLSTSRDDGATFTTEFDLEDDQGQFPTVSTQSDVNVLVAPDSSPEPRVYLAWTDDRNVQDEIWLTSAVLDSTPPTIPSNVRAAPADSALVLTWNPSTDAHGIRGYQVYRASSPNGPFILRSVQMVGGTAYTDVGLEPGVTYYYQVSATDQTGNEGSRSVTVSGAAILTEVQPTGLLLFERDEAIRLRRIREGTEQVLANAVEPVLSNDGTELYYRNDTNIFVWTLSTNGATGAPRLFASREGLFEFDLAADNSHFAFVGTRIQPNTFNGACLVTEPTFATSTQDLFTDDYNLSSFVSISADHRWMAYRYDGFCNAFGFGTATPGDFCLANLQTQQRQCLAGADVNGSDFAPIGNRLVMAAAIGGQRELWMAQVATNGTLLDSVQLTRGAPNQPVDRPRFSTDGQWIVFQRDVNPDPAETAKDWRLFAVRTDGSALRDLGVAGTRPALLGGGGGLVNGWSARARLIAGINVSGDDVMITLSAEPAERVLERTSSLSSVAVWATLTTVPARTAINQTTTVVTLKRSDLIRAGSTQGYLRVGPLASP